MTDNTARERFLQSLVKRFPADAAEYLDAERAQDTAALFASDPELGKAALTRMNPECAASVLAELGANAREIVVGLDLGRVGHLLSRLAESRRQPLLDSLPPEVRDELLEIISYPIGTAGALMDARVAAFPATITVGVALEQVSRMRDRRVSDVVLTGPDGGFIGALPLLELVGSEPHQHLSDLSPPSPVQVQPMTPVEEVVELLNRYRLSSLPVVNLQNEVVGILRHTSLVNAAQENAAIDAARMVGVSKEERALASPWIGVKSRLPWLNINLLTAFLAASVVGLFEGTIAKFTALAVLLPVVAGQSGNTGAQALAVTMRGLALRELRPSHLKRLLAKELAVGFINGCAIAVVTGVGVYAWSRNFGLTLVMFISMIGSMIAASLSGATIPVVLVKLRRDPATASSIILTTITDIVGFFAFLGLATLLANLISSGNLP